MAKTKLNENGYPVFENNPDNLVHRWKAEKKYGKEAMKGKQIHHINLDKQDNSSDNLLLVSKEDHHNIHLRENKIKLLSELIICLSIVILLFSIIGLFSNTALSTIILCAGGIIFLAVEIKYGLVGQAIRRPNEKGFQKI